MREIFNFSFFRCVSGRMLPNRTLFALLVLCSIHLSGPKVHSDTTVELVKCDICWIFYDRWCWMLDLFATENRHLLLLSPVAWSSTLQSIVFMTGIRLALLCFTKRKLASLEFIFFVRIRQCMLGNAFSFIPGLCGWIRDSIFQSSRRSCGNSYFSK